MKRIIVILGIISVITLKAQTKVQNFIDFSPSNITKVNGLSIKYWDSFDNTNYNKKINGIELGLNPIGVFFPFLIFIHSLNPLEIEPPVISTSNIKKTINGLQFSIGNLEEAKINGIEINFSGGINTIVKGISISPSINKHYIIHGISIAPIGNFDEEFYGVQIGLVNKTTNSKGIQIGLWNKNEKRSLPLLNWSF